MVAAEATAWAERGGGAAGEDLQAAQPSPLRPGGAHSRGSGPSGTCGPKSPGKGLEAGPRGWDTGAMTGLAGAWAATRAAPQARPREAGEGGRGRRAARAGRGPGGAEAAEGGAPFRSHPAPRGGSSTWG